MISRYLHPDEARRAVRAAGEALRDSDIRRVERIGPRVLLERGHRLHSGASIIRVTIRVAAGERGNLSEILGILTSPER